MLPTTFDHWWPELLKVSAAQGRERWPHEEALLTLSDDDGAEMVAVAMFALQSRLRTMCDNQPTEAKLWLIARLLYHQLVLPEGYRREHLYRLLTIIVAGDNAALTSPDVIGLLELVWGLKLPADPERPRETAIREWLAAPAAPVDGGLAPVIAELLDLCPRGWTDINGTLTMASGQVLANLAVSGPTIRAALTSLILAPSTIALRGGPGPTDWRAGLSINNGQAQASTLDRDAPPHPAELLRTSDFYGEIPDGILPDDTPAWLRSYCTHGSIDYGAGPRPVLGPPEAIDIVRRAAAERNLGPRFDTQMLVAARLPAGYRVYMYQPPDTPFDQLIVGSPRFYVGDDCRIYRTTAGRPDFADQQFRTAFAERHGYDSTTGEPWIDDRPTILGPRRRNT